MLSITVYNSGEGRAVPRDALTPTVEGLLIRRARQRSRPKISMADAASKAGISVDNWGHIERGYQSMGRDQPPRVVVPPADTLAHMAHAVGITPQELADIERVDASVLLEDLRRREPEPAFATVKQQVPGPDHTSARVVLDSLRARAAAEDLSLGEVLVVEGLAEPDELSLPDGLDDPIIDEINASDISEGTKARLIKLHLDNRARRFEEKRLARRNPDGA